MNHSVETQEKVKCYANFLREILVEDGVPFGLAKQLPDQVLLERFRHCLGCGEELFSPDQQMQAILEFDTPLRSFEALCRIAENQHEDSESLEGEKFEDYEDLHNEEECEDCNKINQLVNDADEAGMCIDCFVCEALEKQNAEESICEDCGEHYCDVCGEVITLEDEIENSICSDCFNEIEWDKPEEDNPNKVIFENYFLAGSLGIDDAIEKTLDLVTYLRMLRDEGFELARPVGQDGLVELERNPADLSKEETSD